MTHYVELIVAGVIGGAANAAPIDGAAHAALLSRGAGSGADLAILLSAAALGLILAMPRDAARIGAGAWRLLQGKRDAGARMLLLILSIAICYFAAFYLVLPLLPVFPRSWILLGSISVGIAILMMVADHFFMTIKRVEHLSWVNALMIGVCSIASFLPGVGFPTVLLIGARALGMERREAMRFAFLAQIPVFLGLSGLAFLQFGPPPLSADAALAGTASFLSVFLLCRLALAWSERFGLAPFVAYRCIFGVFLVLLGLISL